ncbi:unnamed protein product [Heligmosomoides polygyrus]|uniref:PHTB1_N domain-containing protein n=1 Tax=Heligmosomoides polygyrus TaxID=6339 RepID=A0A183GSP3_HELPZ|nr:unnamed protein product [Heligmosomoides polygyrus]
MGVLPNDEVQTRPVCPKRSRVAGGNRVMSLFRVSEWYSTLYPSASCITVGSLVQSRDQLLVGGEDGVLIVLDPGGSEKEPVLVEQSIGQPIIDIMIGEFLPSAGSVSVLRCLRFLHTRIQFRSRFWLC